MIISNFPSGGIPSGTKLYKFVETKTSITTRNESLTVGASTPVVQVPITFANNVVDVVYYEVTTVSGATMTITKGNINGKIANFGVIFKNNTGSTIVAPFTATVKAVAVTI